MIGIGCSMVLAAVNRVVPISIWGVAGGGTAGTAYSFTPTTANGSGVKTFSYSGTSLAGSGLAFNSATGAIAGTPSSAITITATITVHDATGSAQLDVTFTIAGGSFSPSLDFSDPRNSQYL